MLDFAIELFLVALLVMCGIGILFFMIGGYVIDFFNAYNLEMCTTKLNILSAYKDYVGEKVYTIKKEGEPNKEYGEVYYYLGVVDNKVLLEDGYGKECAIPVKKFAKKYHKIENLSHHRCFSSTKLYITCKI